MYMSYLPHSRLIVKFDKYAFNLLKNSLYKKGPEKENKTKKPCSVTPAVFFKVSIRTLINPLWTQSFISYDSTSQCCHAAHI